jgi:hypothetical protein
MADTKLTNLPTLSSIDSTDLLYVVSKQNTIAGESRSMEVGDLFRTISFPLISTDQIISPTITCTDLMESGTIYAINHTGDNVNVTSVSAVTGSFKNVIADFNTSNVTTDLTASYTDHNSRIYNFDTTSSNLSVILPSSLPNGFNIGITNIGTNTVYISSTQTPMLCAVSNKCSTQFGCIFIYKSNNKFIGVGKFS